MNQADLILIGTTHHIQEGRCEERERLAFADSIRRLCSEHPVRAIGEETNAEALLGAGVQSTVAASVAAEFNLPTLFCEPNSQEREALGIQGDQGVQIRAWFDGLTAQQTSEQRASDFAKRESVWLKRLQAANLWPYLFVCGADHTQSFGALLSRARRQVHIASAHWPNE